MHTSLLRAAAHLSDCIVYEYSRVEEFAHLVCCFLYVFILYNDAMVVALFATLGCFLSYSVATTMPIRLSSLVWIPKGAAVLAAWILSIPGIYTPRIFFLVRGICCVPWIFFVFWNAWGYRSLSMPARRPRSAVAHGGFLIAAGIAVLGIPRIPHLVAMALYPLCILAYNIQRTWIHSLRRRPTEIGYSVHASS